MLVHGHFDKIFSCDCTISEPLISGSKMTLPVKDIGVIDGHPLFEKLPHSAIRYFRLANLIFDGVASSVRQVSEAVCEPGERAFRHFSRHDGPFPVVTASTQPFSFEGAVELPGGSVDWTVIAVSFSLEVLDNRPPEWQQEFWWK
jgi:hypothetical protein